MDFDSLDYKGFKLVKVGDAREGEIWKTPDGMIGWRFKIFYHFSVALDD
jgi:hypothetical protein